MPVAVCTGCGLTTEGTADGGPDDYDVKTGGHYTPGCPDPFRRRRRSVPPPYLPTAAEKAFYERNCYWPNRQAPPPPLADPVGLVG